MTTCAPVAPALRNIPAFAAVWGMGAPDAGCAIGAAGFRAHKAHEDLADGGVTLDWCLPPDGLLQTDAPPMDAIARGYRWLAGKTAVATRRGDALVTVGGDHSCAIGTWGGVAAGLRPRGPLGLVWIDAHMDMHTPDTTHSGRIHGMPLACLLGHGAPALVPVAGGAVAPENLCLVGVRSFEPEEMALARRLGVRVITMDDVRRDGLDRALATARAIACHGTAGYGVSLDLDGLDPGDAPGVGSPVSGGIGARDLMPGWRRLTRDRNCLGIEIAEYNPRHDIGGRTAALMGRLVASSFGEK